MVGAVSPLRPPARAPDRPSKLGRTREFVEKDHYRFCLKAEAAWLSLSRVSDRAGPFARPGPGAEPRFPHTAGTRGEGRDRVDARFQPGLIGPRGMARIDGAC